MKLYRIDYQVQFKEGKQTLTIKDSMMVPAKSPQGARAFFLRTLTTVPVLLMRYDDKTRIMAPLRELGGEVSVINCTAV